MPNSFLDDLGFGSPTTTAQPRSAAAPVRVGPGDNPPGWSYPFSADVVRTIAGEGDPASVATTLWNRKQNSGADYDDLITQPNQYEARTGSDWGANVRLGPDSPKFQTALNTAAPILLGQQPPLGTYDSFYSPKGQIAKGRVNSDGSAVVPDFAAKEEAAGQHGVNIGGNVFYTTGWGKKGGQADPPAAGGAPGSVLNDLGFGSDTAAAPAPKPAAPTPGASPQAAFPLIDPNTGELRGYTTEGQTAAITADKTRTGQGSPGSRTNPYGYGPDQGVLKGGDWYYPSTGGAPVQYKDPDTLLQTAESVGKFAGNPLFYGTQLFGEGQLDPRTQAAVEAFKNNVAFGGASKLEGGAAALAGGNYNATVAAQDAYRNALRERFPGVYDTSAVAGAVAPMFAGAEGAEIGARAIGEAAPAAETAFRAATGTLRPENAFLRLAANAPGAAGTAAVQGFMQGAGGSRAPTLQGQVSDAAQQAQQAAEYGFLAHGAAGTGGAIKSALAPLTEPFTAAGRTRLAGGLIQDYLGKPTGAPATDFTEYVPDSRPTLAQATIGPERIPAAAAERSLAKDPVIAQERAAVRNEQDEARHAYVDPVISTPSETRAARDTARANLEPMRSAAFADKVDVDPQPVLDKIDEILASPDGKITAVQRTLQSVRKGIVNKEGTPAEYDSRTLPPTQTRAATPPELETDPEQLWGVRMDMDAKANRLSPDYPDTVAAGKQLNQVREVLNGVIDQGAPNFQPYNDAYRTAMKPLNAQEFLQDHSWTNAPSVNSPTGEFSLPKVDNGIKRIEAARAQPGWNAAKDIADEDLQKLYNLRADLTRSNLNSALAASGRAPTITGTLEAEPAHKLLSSPLALGLAADVVSRHPALGATVGFGKQMLDALKNRVVQQAAQNMMRPNEANPFMLPASAPSYGPGRFNKLLRSSAAAIPRVQSSPAPKRPRVVIP